MVEWSDPDLPRLGSEDEYVRQVGRIVHTIESHGRGVVVGRGSQFIVTPSSALRVRFECSFEERVRRCMKARDLSARAGKREVERGERDRQHFIRETYGEDVTAPTHYDLVLNLGTVSLETAADIVVAAYEARFGSPPR